MEYREVTMDERQAMMEEGIFDVDGNIPAHPGYTGIHRHKDGTYWFYGKQVTDPKDIYIIEHREEIRNKKIQNPAFSKEDVIVSNEIEVKSGLVAKIKSLLRRSKWQN